MDKSGLNADATFLNNEQILHLQNYNFDNGLLESILPAILRLRVNLINLNNHLTEISSKDFIFLYENSIQIFNTQFSFIDQSDKFETNGYLNHLKSIFTESGKISDNFSDFVSGNTSILGDAFFQYISEIYSVANEIADKTITTNALKPELTGGYNISGQELNNGATLKSNQGEINNEDFQYLVFSKLSSGLLDSFVAINKSFCDYSFVWISKFFREMEMSKYFESGLLNEQEKFAESSGLISLFPESFSHDLNNTLSEIKSTKEFNLTEQFQKLEFEVENAIYQAIAEVLKRDQNYNRQNFIENRDTLEDKIHQVSNNINKKSLYFFDQLRLNISLDKIKISLYIILKNHCQKNIKIIEDSLEAKNKKLINEINSTIQQFSLNKISEIRNIFDASEKIKTEIYSEIEDAVDSLVIISQNLINSVQERVELIKASNINEINYGYSEESGSLVLLAKKITDDIFGKYLYNKIKAFVPYLINSMNEIDNQIINQNRLIRYNVFRYDNNVAVGFNQSNEIDVLKFLNDELNKATKNKLKIEELTGKTTRFFSEIYNSVFEKLNVKFFKEEAQYFGQYLPKKQSRNLFAKAKLFLNLLKGNYDKLIHKFWIHQSDASILKDEILGKNFIRSNINCLLNTIEPLTLSKEINNALPYYYKNLFLSKSSFNNEFWIGRNKELERAQIAYSRFFSGVGGALLICGERYSGKSFMIRYISSNIIKSDKTIIVEAPESGMPDSKSLLRNIQEQTGLKGDLNKVLAALPQKSIVILDDLELWWEKSENGSKVISQIFKIIEQFSKNIFFIISLNVNCMNSIDRVYKFRDLFLDILYCKPFNSESLQEIILFRHHISGLKFELKTGSSIGGKNKEESFRKKHYARLFSKYFNYSGGNVGICLRAWMSDIIKIDGERITMKIPSSIGLSDFGQLEKDDLLVLYHLLIHKKMDIEKLSRVFLTEDEKIRYHIDFLERSGLVVENNKVFEINPYIYHLVIKILRDNDML